MPIDWLDAYPDRFDERDYPFQPRLQAAPVRYSNENARFVSVLSQREGACTGYAAAGLVNLLLFSQQRRNLGKPITRVSPAMLYHLARIYDEWEGEDYSGSSCRGVLKGWHHHGVCSEHLWKDEGAWSGPKREWCRDAADHPIGAYYRVDSRSITDLRLAILEAGAVLVAARIHKGWLGRLGDECLTAIRFDPGPRDESSTAGIPPTNRLGLHAFLLVGYDETGFVVQNSWGRIWGSNGFAILTYRDWLENGVDAWVVSLGAPADPQAFESKPYRTWGGLLEIEDSAKSDRNGLEKPGPEWTEPEARQHSIVFAKNGQPAQRWVTMEDGKSEIKHHLTELVRESSDLLIYFPGGLESEQLTLARIRRIGHTLTQVRKRQKHVTPLFVLWRDGLLDEIQGVISAQLAEKAATWSEVQAEARDRRFELMARRFIRPLWTEVRSDARHAASPDGGLEILAQNLREAFASRIARKPRRRLRLHLAAHSAGVVPLAYFLEKMGRGKQSRSVHRVDSCTLLAPLCSVSFALCYFRQAFEEGVLQTGSLTCEGLQAEVDHSDGVGDLYGPSLAILASRVLERDCQTPILCLQELWSPPPEGERWPRHLVDAAREWRNLRAVRDVRSIFLSRSKSGVRRKKEPFGHRYFECDPDVLKRLAKRCLS